MKGSSRGREILKTRTAYFDVTNHGKPRRHPKATKARKNDKGIRKRERVRHLKRKMKTVKYEENRKRENLGRNYENVTKTKTKERKKESSKGSEKRKQGELKKMKTRKPIIGTFHGSESKSKKAVKQAIIGKLQTWKIKKRREENA